MNGRGAYWQKRLREPSTDSVDSAPDSLESKRLERDTSPCLFCGNTPNGCWCDRVFLQLANKPAYEEEELPNNQLGFEVNEW